MRASTVRKLCLSLPEAEERETWETATFRVRGKIFVMFSEHEREAWIKATSDEQAALISMDPGVFFFPPYVGKGGWIGVRIAKADRAEVAELIVEAWRLRAPKRLQAAYDDEHPVGA
ncbi:MAG TPA: MmcQ/YjbR family DNA-binding protein [Actinomycetota bacterium]|nr:MmcQ/YjbR family DNA-binding protein [Actinomycetota bacterium]